MTMVTNSVTSYGTPTKREDLVDAIYRIDPEDTPFTNSIPRVKAKAVLHEWSKQALSSVNTTNAHLEGDETSRQASTTPTRAVNYCQISKRNATVSGTERSINIAGINDMMDYQKSLKSVELRKDMEAIVLGNTGYTVGATNAARTLRSFNSWFAGNASRGTGGADSTAATAAATDGNTTNGLRTFDEVLLKAAVKAAYDDGGKPSRVFLGSGNKQIFSGFTGRANSQQQIGNADKILASASVYGSDFGDLMVIPNRTQRARDVFVVDTTKVALAGLRMFEENELGRIGDADTVELISEYTLENRHEDAHAMVADTNAT
ncbi:MULTISPECIES: SU10 major capsid protein [Alphaproteobacteria]|uniref:SU10 major capsid protein n=1 Tax=Sphingopyxis sp. TaxID=1908224 RepID=UPI004034E022